MSPLPVSNITEENQFAIDKELYDTTLSIRDEMNLISERVSKMDEHKGSVSEAVYLKVKSDYLAHHDNVRKVFEEKKQSIQSALQNLYRGKSEQEAEMKKHQEILEEAKFRNFLGEHTDKKFKEIENRENSEVKRYESLLLLIDSNIKQYEDLIGGPVPLFQEPVVEEKAKVNLSFADESVSIAKSKIHETDFSDEAYTLEGEGNYFQNDDLNNVVSPISDATTALPVENLPKLKTKKIAPASDLEEIPTSKQSIKAKTEKSKTGLGFDDSISSILKSIPLDEPLPEEKLEDIPKEVMQSAEEELLDLSNPRLDEDMEDPIDMPSLEAGKARVICIEGDISPAEFELDDNTSIGRSPSNDIVLKEPKVSRQHAAINLIDGNYVIVDLKSSNGIYVNGRKVEEVVLEDGDELLIGNSKFTFHAA